VGLLAQRLFGFSGASTVTGDTRADVANARALGSALLAVLAVPWALCLCIYTGLHFTYPRDRRAAMAISRAKTPDTTLEADLEPLALPPGGGNGGGGGGGGRAGSAALRQGGAAGEERALLGPDNA
jgi:hypothetical protein